MVKGIRNGALLILAALLCWQVAGRFASPESRIRSLLAATAAAFNDGSLRRSLAGFHPTWRDGNTGLDRERLRQGLGALFLTRRERADRFLAEPDLEALHLEIDEPGDGPARARARFPLVLYRLRGKERQVQWRALVAVKLVRDPSLDWCFTASSWEGAQGRLPGR